jgi:hypothetical protein
MWSLFTMGADVGLTTTEAGGLMKVNLHESGSWQIGYTSEYTERQHAAGKWQGQSRHWQIWQRPQPVTPGHTAALKILVPAGALHARQEPKKSKRVRWIESREGKAVSFTIWLSKTTIPAWGYGADHDVVGTLSLPNGEYVLIGAHYVDSTEATTVMLKGLGGFLQTLMAQDTTALDPLPVDATLMGFSAEPSGVRTITEIALWSLAAADAAPDSNVGKEPLGHGMDEALSKGLVDISVPIPRSYFESRGVDPKQDPDGAQRLVEEWTASKVAEMRRLLSLPSSR